MKTEAARHMQIPPWCEEYLAGGDPLTYVLTPQQIHRLPPLFVEFEDYSPKFGDDTLYSVRLQIRCRPGLPRAEYVRKVRQTLLVVLRDIGLCSGFIDRSILLTQAVMDRLYARVFPHGESPPKAPPEGALPDLPICLGATAYTPEGVLCIRRDKESIEAVNSHYYLPLRNKGPKT